MKRFHEVGFIRSDIGELCGTVLKCGGVRDNSRYLIVDWKNFINEVRLGRVQYFVINKDGKLDVAYSDEEKAEIKSAGGKLYKYDDYFKNDMYYRKQYIDLINAGCIYVKCVAMFRSALITVCSFICIGEDINLQHFAQILEVCKIKFTYSGNNLSFSIPLQATENVLLDCCGLLIDTDDIETAERVFEDNLKRATKFIIKKAKNEDKSKFAIYANEITANTIRQLRQNGGRI